MLQRRGPAHIHFDEFFTEVKGNLAAKCPPDIPLNHFGVEGARMHFLSPRSDTTTTL